jgi:hypothetical protein
MDGILPQRNSDIGSPVGTGTVGFSTVEQQTRVFNIEITVLNPRNQLKPALPR